MSQADSFVNRIAAVATRLDTADHVDIKTVETTLPMRHFIAGMLAYQPSWMTVLYRVRWLFVRLLGLKQTGIPPSQALTPTDISLTPGDKATFFTVVAAAEEEYWLVAATESHLTAHLGVVVEPLADERRVIHVMTIVHYHSWAGPVYFNVIRPFHHIVVRAMINAGKRADSSDR